MYFKSNPEIVYFLIFYNFCTLAVLAFITTGLVGEALGYKTY